LSIFMLASLGGSASLRTKRGTRGSEVALGEHELVESLDVERLDVVDLDRPMARSPTGSSGTAYTAAERTSG
jgi:hypothetical protein